jgi:murein DD-endopeptidase MepM/ murein hydrolase activator NlpD
MQKRCFSKLILIFLLLIPVSLLDAQESTEEAPPRIERPEPSRIMEGSRLSLEFYFETIPQGRAKLLYLYGDNLVSASAHFLNRDFRFYRAADGLYAFLAADMTQSTGTFALTVTGTFANGPSEELSASIEVVSGGFIRQDISLSDKNGYLADTELEADELAFLQSVFSRSELPPLWDENSFQPPLDSTPSSPFGVFRIFDETTESRHTGWDMQARTGIPILSTAAGQVAFAGPLDIRGNYVLIDHGDGIFSGYAHLSVIYVTQGQTIAAGQVIGQSGNTGRSGGAHFHWEMAVDGIWVDSFDFIEMWIPEALARTSEDEFEVSE